MTALTLPQISGDTIDADLFGGNFLADRYMLDENDDVARAVDALGITGLRYPGGSLTERLFDITDPDSSTAIEDDGTEVEFVGLSEFMAFAEEAGQSVSIVIPTRDFLSDQRDANGDRFPDFDEAALRSFVRGVAEGDHGEAEVTAFEVGNEYWGSGEMTAVEYGRLASEMARVIDEELDLVAAETGEDPAIDIIVQTGTNFGSSDLRAQYEGQPSDEILADLNARYGTEFGDEVMLSADKINWRMVNDELVQKEFDAIELEAVDGVVTHLYSKDPVQPGQREFGLDTIQKTWIEDNPELDIHVTEWNQSASDTRYDSEQDFGLMKAHEVLNTFETLVASSVDYANVWPLLQNTRNALQPDGHEGELSPTGALFSMMSDALPGKQMLDFDTAKNDVTEFQASNADVHGFYGDGEMVLYVVSTSDKTETLSFDLDGMVAGGGVVTGQILGVREGDAPGSTKARADLEELEEEDFYDDGLVAVTLGPGEILEVRIDGFLPTDAFAAAMVSAESGPPFTPPVADDGLDDLPTIPMPEEEDDFDEPEADDDGGGGDGGGMDALAWLLGLLPLLALGGMG